MQRHTKTYRISLDALKSGVSFRSLRFSRRHPNGEPGGTVEDDEMPLGQETLLKYSYECPENKLMIEQAVKSRLTGLSVRLMPKL